MKLLFLTVLFALAFSLIESLPVELEARATSYKGGRGTWYSPGLGSCGKKNKASEKVCALSSKLMKKGKYCGKTITVKSGNKSVKCKVVDSCPGCSINALDLSPTAFKALAPLSKGVIKVSFSI